MNDNGEVVESSPQVADTLQRELTPIERRQKVWRGWINDEFAKVTRGEMTEENLKDVLAEKYRQIDDVLTKQIQIGQSRAELLNVDELSEIPNGYEFDNDIDELIRNGEKFGLLMLDIDNFRRLNTEFGHSGGDKAIRHLARTLDTTIRTKENQEQDERPIDKVYRLHGDELSVILRGINTAAGCLSVAERLRTAIETNPAKIEQQAVPLSISIGGAVYGGQAVGDFIDLVDKKALYAAKEKGKNNSFIIGLDTEATA